MRNHQPNPAIANKCRTFDLQFWHKICDDVLATPTQNAMPSGITNRLFAATLKLEEGTDGFGNRVTYTLGRRRAFPGGFMSGVEAVAVVKPYVSATTWTEHLSRTEIKPQIGRLLRLFGRSDSYDTFAIAATQVYGAVDDVGKSIAWYAYDELYGVMPQGQHAVIGVRMSSTERAKKFEPRFLFSLVGTERTLTPDMPLAAIQREHDARNTILEALGMSAIDINW